MKNDNPTPNSKASLLGQFQEAMGERLHLWDQTDHEGTRESISEGIEFKGATVWTLMIAIALASIGLNTNSPALIIGAMLISPLLGPIMGAGMALGMYDLQLLKRSLVNLGVMTGLSLIVSFAYFALSPLKGLTPELMARTTPTFFDVLVALFGGAAMIIAVSRKSRSTNTIAGVAIATALMPPLCTAGYGIANQDGGIFLGASYLYLINSVFIGLTTFLFTKYLHLAPQGKESEKGFSPKKLALGLAVIIVFLVPSFYMAYDVIQETSFQSKVDKFLSMNMQFPDSQISSVIKKRATPNSHIQVTIAGKPLSEEMIKHLNSQLPSFGLPDTELKVIQTSLEPSASTIAATAIPQITPAPNQTPLPTAMPKEPQDLPLSEISQEISVLFPELEAYSWGDMMLGTNKGSTNSIQRTVLVRWNEKTSPETRNKFQVFLKLRLGNENLTIVPY